MSKGKNSKEELYFNNCKSVQSMPDAYIIPYESSKKYGVSRASKKVFKKQSISDNMTCYVTVSTASKSVTCLRP